MAIKYTNNKIRLLGMVAVLLVGITVYDRTIGLGKNVPHYGDATGTVTQTSPSGRGAHLINEVSGLRFFLAYAPEIKALYQKMAVPYAEAVATFSTLYAAGENPELAARKYLTNLLSLPVKIGDVLISKTTFDDQAAILLTANLNFSSSDSSAFMNALITLGDASNGTVWKELVVTSDPDKRELRASGQLTLLMVEQVE